MYLESANLPPSVFKLAHNKYNVFPYVIFLDLLILSLCSYSSPPYPHPHFPQCRGGPSSPQIVLLLSCMSHASRALHPPLSTPPPPPLKSLTPVITCFFLWFPFCA